MPKKCKCGFAGRYKIVVTDLDESTVLDEVVMCGDCLDEAATVEVLGSLGLHPVED